MATLIVALGSLLAAISLAATAVLLPPPRRERILKTLAAYTGGRTQEKDEQEVRAESTVSRVLFIIGSLLGPPGDRDRLTRGLDRAGNPPDWPLDKVIRMRPLTAAGLTWFLWALGDTWKGDPGAIGGAVAGFVLGCLLPQILVNNQGVKRQELMQRNLPDVMDALVIGVEAGLGLDSAMDQVARTMRGPMADELRRVLQEMRLGVSRAEALRSLSGRTTVRDLKRLVTALVQAGDLGISVAPILREHAADQRVRRRQRAEEQAQKIPVKLLFPVLFCMFPAIFVIIIGPAVLELAGAFG
ncbi:type II secretion system protein [Actinoplanes sp. OR16]|uniref:type II secretion system F family protein n=1 Tax=Actinoplanes sp. OR16 TaxID=946334 RepID=UPI000F703A95|nr:type II secretion system F family protein [Actinoplanes sp. OR16]BBH67330.1 type II secretion system protein [Actinoplanes sp. OR16]